MELQHAEHIVIRSQPVYPELTDIETLAVQRIRLRARACPRIAPCSPLPGRLGWVWLSVLLTLMLVRALLALFG